MEIGVNGTRLTAEIRILYLKLHKLPERTPATSGEPDRHRIADKKKPEMAEAAEQLLAGTRWLPPILRTKPPAWLAMDEQPEAHAMEDEPFAVAAE